MACRWGGCALAGRRSRDASSHRMAQRPGSDGCGARAMVIHPRAARVRALDERCACARNASCCGTTAARAADGKRARRGLSITKYEALEHTCAKLFVTVDLYAISYYPESVVCDLWSSCLHLCRLLLDFAAVDKMGEEPDVTKRGGGRLDCSRRLIQAGTIAWGFELAAVRH